MGLDILPISYEELLEDTAGTVRKVLKHCSLFEAANSTTLEKNCEAARAIDSQGKSEFISREKVEDKRNATKQGSSREQSDKRAVMDEVFQACGLPPSKEYKTIFEKVQQDQ